jgi:pimeloyl-ACP methyl ester carboxylesterase
VCPSPPGYGFSDKPTRRGWNVERIAGAWARLMARLGYQRNGAQGSDWGTSISTSVGQQDPDHVAGIHLAPPLAPPDPATFDDLTEAEQAALATLEHAAEWDSGYSQEPPSTTARPSRWIRAGSTSGSRRFWTRSCAPGTHATSRPWRRYCETTRC